MLDGPVVSGITLMGRNAIIPDEDWEVRKMAVVERIPVNPRHPHAALRY